MKKTVRRFMILLAALLLAACFTTAATADVLHFGADGVFGINMREGWTYYQPARSAGEVTEEEAEAACADFEGRLVNIDADGLSGFITYYAMDGITDLTVQDQIIRVLGELYDAEGMLFETNFTITPIEGGVLITQYKVKNIGNIDFASAYLFLKDGILVVSSVCEVQGEALTLVNELLGDLVLE